MSIDKKKAVERAKRQQQYVTNYVKKNYYRVSVTLPKDYKNRLKAAGVKSVNGYINKLVAADLERLETLPPEPEEVEPDEWDIAMIEEAKKENDGSYVTIDELLEEEGLTYADL